ncbi:hypothetical protein QJQ45_026110 [Haematococcus lacustris]|nr:hypothetical protein QJQ45_026110 [Haematococcus lacustris]
MAGVAAAHQSKDFAEHQAECSRVVPLPAPHGPSPFGCRLVPMTEDEWMEEGVQGALMPGQEIVARIYKLRQPGLFRWPVQLELLMPQAVAARLTPPEEYMPPINHAWASDQGWQIEDICQAAGRPFHAAEYYLNTDDEQSMEDMQLAYGFDDPEESRLPLTQELQDKLDERAVMQTQNAVSSMF